VRTFMSLLLALVASFASGTLVVQLVAQAARGDEVYILAFVWVPLVVCICLVVLGLTSSIAGTAAAVDRAALVLGVLAAVAGIGLLIWSLVGGGGASFGREGPLIAAFVAPTWMVILTQWWFLRRHRARVADQGAR
jgi:hypothetical protein